MAIVTRYFSTTAAGATDGTTWADRAALFTAGVWSPVLITFAFNGTDSLKCLVGPGTYTCGAALTSGLFANPPSAANPLVFCGCDSSGVLLAAPDPNWLSAEPVFSAASFPVITTTTNVATIGIANVWCYLMKFTASGRNGGIITSVAGLTWCHAINSTANTSATAITLSSATRLYGLFLNCTGTSYSAVFDLSATSVTCTNLRVEGVTGSSGNRRGITTSAATNQFELCTIVNCAGDGIVYTGSSATQQIRVRNSVIANNGGTGIKAVSTASQTEYHETHNCMITGNGAYGIDGQSGARWITTGNRLRDNSTGNITGLGNFPVDLNNYTTDSDDATDYVDAAGGDFRVKNTAAIWGQGYGVSDQAAAATGRRRVIGG